MATSNDGSVRVASTRKLYNSNPVARAALDALAGRRNNSTITTVDRMLALVRRRGIEASRSDVLEFFRSLDSLGYGNFVIGRKGHPSRFMWSVNLVDVGRVATGEAIDVERLDPATTSASSNDELLEDEAFEHCYRLRPDYEVRLELPRDLTTTEANRLAEFIRTLPFA